MPLVNCTQRDEASLWDVVGPVCETGDFLARSIELAAQPGDVLAMTGAGAYGMSMASNYNSRSRAAEVLVERLPRLAHPPPRNDRRSHGFGKYGSLRTHLFNKQFFDVHFPVINR